MPERLSPFGFLLEDPAIWAAQTAEDTDVRFLAAAYGEATKVVGRTHPNPSVGAVIVKGGTIVGAGRTAAAGGPHAEVGALKKAGTKAKGATLYVTMEPCVHVGRTGPCVDAIITAGIERVIVGTRDPNPLVDGKGIKKLRRAGIEVALLERTVVGKKCAALIEPFRKHIAKGRPFVVAKVAASLDGKVATLTGHARWVSGPESRRVVHQLRDRLDAVMVGAGTVLNDDPSLTVRDLPGRRRGRNPLRVVVDGQDRVPKNAKVFLQRKGDRAPLVVGPGDHADLKCKARKGHTDLADAFAKLGDIGVTSVLVEPGPGLFTALVERKLIDELWWFAAPIVVGDDGVSAIGPRGRSRMDKVPRLENPRRHLVGDDVLFIGSP